MLVHASYSTGHAVTQQSATLSVPRAVRMSKAELALCILVLMVEYIRAVVMPHEIIRKEERSHLLSSQTVPRRIQRQRAPESYDSTSCVPFAESCAERGVASLRDQSKREKQEHTIQHTESGCTPR